MSDRIEKESEESEVVKRLEWGGAKIVKGDWKKHITQELQEGLVLISFRKYMGLVARKPVFGCLRTTQAQTSLRIHAV